MRSGAGADSRLPGARRVALLLFFISVVLPTVVVLRRGSGSYFSSDDSSSDGALDDVALDLGSPRPTLQKRAAAELGVEGTRVLVFVAREQSSAVELHVRTDAAGVRDVCSGASQAQEAYAAAAERILWACATLGPPPDVEFLERAVKELTPGAPVPFVALVRAERLKLRGNKLQFVPLKQIDDDVAAGASFAPGVSEALPAARAFLAPWVATAGKKAGACGPPPAGTAVS